MVAGELLPDYAFVAGGVHLVTEFQHSVYAVVLLAAGVKAVVLLRIGIEAR